MTGSPAQILTQLLSTVGVIVAATAAMQFYWIRRRGGGPVHTPVAMFFAGAMLACQRTLIPWGLKLMDSFTALVTGEEPAKGHRLVDKWERFIGENSPTEKPKPTPKPSSGGESSGPDIQTILTYGLLALVAVIVLGAAFLVFTKARAKRDDMLAAAEERREERARAAAIRAGVDAQWKDLHERAATVEKDWAAYDKDLALLLKAPAMRDFGAKTTAELVDALQEVSTTRTKTAPEGTTNALTTPYAIAVQNAEGAWRAAIRYATKQSLSSMSKDERRSLEQAQQLLATAQNAAATPAERASAYERVQRIMERLQLSDFQMPKAITMQIENETREMLEAAR